MYKERLILSVLMIMVFIAPQAQAENILELNDAYKIVLEQNPQVQSYKARIMAAEGNRLQESLMPNPEAIFEAENFGGDSPRNGLDETEYTLGIEQKLEVSGKRSKREQVADIEKKHISQEALAGIQAVLANTKATYMRVVIAQEKLNLTDKRVILTDKTHKTVKERINVAKAADIQHTKTDLEVSLAKVAQQQAEKELIFAKISLANLMGIAELEQSITADLNTLPDIPDRQDVLQAIQQTPMNIMSQLSVMREDAALNLAKANGKADPTFGIGVRRFAEDDGTAFLASISIPINVFDRNQGRIAEAKANVLVAKSAQTAQRLQLEKQVMEMWQTLVSMREEVLVYENTLLPSAQRAYVQAEDGFNRGAFSFLDLLDAQRTLFDVQEKHLEALESFHETKASIDMISGTYAQIAAASLNENTIKKE